MSSLGLSQKATEQQEYYKVFTVELDTAAFDALDPVKRYHEGIFVQLYPDENMGPLFHVTGDIISALGMRYERRDNFFPDKTTHLHRYLQIGWARKADFDLGSFDNILQALPRPTRQQGINFWEKDPVTNRHEIIWVRQDGERYEPGEVRRPIFKCNEWVHQHAIPALRNAGVLRSDV
ncbi:hypothetical protein LOZ52_006656 [Ophidiomyces ophidiicola]|uniref:uncharacterized protein n=1 Tax=Ophidiomyces ophidiicola TaxID=1387563 RepID=UPI0020C25D55|nr:uncharacterized protein LOZ57_006445 [Ophidiomyces ophidiicola]KAI1937896.1 hypothetical protein LOZ57_006445 [Ophidiomyces ophidiicola]KAI2001430.1 hypothetical protein LOZ50_005667 [Ophidiomyces ophidiicola]KAI2016004.1 hypothetical protein LOZ46_005104 [Ophidiomyces ophidiicola]KAI2030632.1 hypothetical protein LOZ47_006421 [Ophidiomyces ophidiicola]KAI2071821.1 hypothetical protein LOZ37_004517 [Ophidiomyces ophidiicola]